MHHRRDWNHYNQHLINRGKINFWVSPQVFKLWKAKKQKKNGRPYTYSNDVFIAMSFIRFKYHLSLRETEGFFQSILTLMGAVLRVPSYTQFCRRLKSLKLPAELVEKKYVTDIVLDTTGLKVHGAGEWRAQKYGGRKRWKRSKNLLFMNIQQLSWMDEISPLKKES